VPFELGTDDFTGRLQIPQKLYGRQAEIQQLKTIFNRAITGSAQLLLIAGYSGVGKTSLVHEIQKEVITKQAIFIEGKFDQFHRALPYSAWEQAFTQLVNNWLAGSETSLAGWRETILDSVGDNGQILIDIIPALERIIGPQPKVPQLRGIENQNRFNYYFSHFISSLATSENSLVVFLDDLQWIDLASLNLIETLFTAGSTNNLLVIGAYRNNEVGADHPLVASQDRMRAESDQVTVITLGDLALDDTNQLLVDSLQLSVADCRDLNRVLVDKTAGNPFYFHQLLYTLESEKVLSFDRRQRRWVWEEELQQSLQTGDNVAELMIRRIRTLPVETQGSLSMAACLGNRFDTSTLTIIIGQEQRDILTALSPALQDGLIIGSNGYFSFVHDRIQEAGYALIPESDRPKTHLEIGRLLLAGAPAGKLEEEIFAIVGHLNAGRALIDTDREKLDLAELNLKAGQKAKSASAFVDAKKHIEIGLSLLGPDSWQGQYELTLSLHNENGELASITGQYDQVAPIADLIHANAESLHDQVRIYMVQIEAATTLYDFNAAVEIGLDVLEKLGFEIVLNPGSEDYQYLIKRFSDLLTDRPMEVIAGLSEMTDERVLAASTLITATMVPIYIIKPQLFPVVGFTGAILTLEFGYFTWSPHFFSQMGVCSWLALDLGTPSDHVLDSLLWIRQTQEAVLEMLENPVFTPCIARGYLGIYMTGAYHWPIEKSIELAQKAFQSGLATGDLLFGSQGSLHFAMLSLAAGMNLDEYQSQSINYIQELNRLNQSTIATYLSIYLQGAINFKEPLAEPHRLVGSYFDEEAFLSAANTTNDVTGRHLFYAVKLMLGYHFDADNELPEYIREAEKFTVGGPGLITLAINQFYSALGWLRFYSTLSPENQKTALNQIAHSLHLMEIWSQSAPTTFQHMYDLIRAEKARVSGDIDRALVHYERAIQGAQEVGFTHNEALANELYARFWAERDNNRFAGQFMREAYSLYRKWGALAKANHLAKRYPNWLIGRSIVVDQPGTQIVSDELTGDLDLRTVLKASQDIAGEIELDSLLVKLMSNVIENSGAQQGYLILEQDGQWKIVAEAAVDDTETYVRDAKNIAETDLLAQGIVYYVARTQETVVLEDASQSGEFVQDPYVQNHQARSILSTPLINQGKTSGILYLENNLASRVFSAQRVNLLKLLSSQMAISIDNARIHDHLEAVVAERTQELQAANQAKSIFLANMSHELRTPLNAILGFTRLMTRDPDVTAQQQEELKIINRSGEHLLDMVDDILSLSRIEAGRVELKEEPFDLRQMLEDIGGIFQSPAEGKGQRLRLELTDDLPPYLLGDAGKLRQVVINLMGNAVKFTETGEVWLRARTQAMEENPDRVMLQLEVEDSGPGIPPDNLDRIFETFVRLDQALHTQRGTGLGLAISKTLVDMMGGKISVKSEPGEGSMFTINIPFLLAEAWAATPSETPAAEVIGLTSGQPDWRILVVDDNRENLLLLRDLLSRVGFNIQEAKDGEEAIAKFQEWHPHFIWMDMRMP
ncbi:MAG: AAA family ATPase, partial [Desulfosarcina sp.]|nr:AAA family ATPase [Desulfobacterales bacterium]